MAENDDTPMVHRSETLSDADIRAAIAGLVCRACDGVKRRGQPFCPTCWSALTWQARADMSQPDGEGLLQNFRRHLRHLQLNPVRRRRFAVDGLLPYRSLAEIEDAGWRFLGRAPCGVPRCPLGVLWFRNPSGRRVCLGENLQFHKSQCADPEYFERRRAVKTSAKGREKAS